jgi:hypothetical protein
MSVLGRMQPNRNIVGRDRYAMLVAVPLDLAARVEIGQLGFGLGHCPKPLDIIVTTATAAHIRTPGYVARKLGVCPDTSAAAA